VKPADAAWCRRLRPLLGTFVSIESRAADAGIAERALQAGFAAIARVEALMHPTRAGSDLARIGAAATGETVWIDDWTWEVLALSQRLHELSGGSFDPCVPDAAGRLGDIALPGPGLAVCRAPVAIDLGGIAKGYAVDRAIGALQAAGASAGIVNAGGDLRVFGPDELTVWIRMHTGARSIALADRACAVSDPAAAESPAEHRGYYNRVHPARVVVQRQAIVVAPTAALADALTKCVLLCVTPDEQRTLERMLASVGATTL
jgi:FAD:protein FMN transferase